MKPDNPDERHHLVPLVPQRSLLHRPYVPSRETRGQEAAVNIARQQLSSIYGGNTTTPTPQTTPVPQSHQMTEQPAKQPENTPNPYARTHSQPHVSSNAHEDQWKHYHSAWQDYYQKYYERYYLNQLYKTRKSLESRAAEASNETTQPAPAATPETPASLPSQQSESLSRSEAMHELRGKLLDKMRTSAIKARKSRHFIPITAATCVVLLFLFLQYNRVLFANVQAYISPGNIDPANIIVDPTMSVPVGSEPKLIIPKINIDVPVVFNTKPDHQSQMKAMENGVAWFGIPGADSKPGQVGNTVLSGHSSNDIVDQGNYKFIFARLEQLNHGDMIYINYEGKRYSYTVTKKEVVKPTEVQKLVYPTEKPVLTLITCTPLGTALNRLLVTAEQVSPDPSAAQPAPAGSASSSSSEMPGNSPTFIERIFGN